MHILAIDLGKGSSGRQDGGNKEKGSDRHVDAP
jgi:hypothetical protein